MEWLDKGGGKGNRFSSLEIQNEFLTLTSHKILREIMEDIKKAGHYSIMANKTADKSNTEQLSLVPTSENYKFSLQFSLHYFSQKVGTLTRILTKIPRYQHTTKLRMKKIKTIYQKFALIFPVLIF